MRRAISLSLLPLGLLIIGAAVAQAPVATLDRLFYSARERALLDARRDGRLAATAATPEAATNAAPTGAAPAAAPPEPVQLNGVVRSSSGRTTVWLNGETQPDGGYRLGADHALSLRLSSGRKLIMKPGQSYDAVDGIVQEARGR